MAYNEYMIANLGILVCIVSLGFGYFFIFSDKKVTRARRDILVLNLLALLLFLFSLFDSGRRGYFAGFDVFLNRKMSTIWTPVLTFIMKIITALGGTTILSVAAVLLVLYFFYKKRKAEALFAFVVVFGGMVSSQAIKQILQIPRPVHTLVRETTFSFPSGHATMSVVFFGVLYYLVRHHLKIHHERLLALFAIIFPLLVGFSRIYLGAHWFSDVIGGLLLGIFWLTFALLFVSTKQSSLIFKTGGRV